MINFKPLSVLVLLVLFCGNATAQIESFTMKNSKAIIQRNFAFEGRTAAEVYKAVNRWLVNYYRDPEENLKARIEDEYLRGIGYEPNFLKSGTFTGSDLQYTYTISLAEEEVLVAISDVVLIHDSTWGINNVYRLEDYFKPTKNKKRDADGEHILEEVTHFSASLFDAFKNSVFPVNDQL